MSIVGGHTPLVGDSAPMRRLRALVQVAATSHLPVLVQGATGTGKELVASALHRGSGRRGPLVAFNVCAIGDTMFEDALFGHVRGAFTGAHADVPGYLREAHGGTAFLDEIGSLPLGMQAKLLRAVETGVFRPVGAARDASSDFRLVTATNERLDALVAEGRFRSDLAHRLGAFVVQLPSLEDRLEDVPSLVQHFLRVLHPEELVVVDSAALRLLQQRAWPGNVRELRYVVEVAAAFAGGAFTLDAVRFALSQRESCGRVARYDDGLQERTSLVEALERARWDIDVAAHRLGVHRATLYRRMKRLGVERRGARGAMTDTMLECLDGGMAREAGVA
ncbi:MAG TPA: sigma 54-interacting transcriptional regulator [Gemmatimonadaceae bacterium]|nr:sigma 54-interacting transcriptional regulator [Gemmatimonadaceae bacterium]